MADVLAEQDPSGPGPAWLPQRTEMAHLVRHHDWERTPLGPIGRWPVELRCAVVAMLDSPYPQNVLWGPSLVQLYNDAFRPTLERRHPRALGQPTADCWPEFWDFNEPIYRRVLGTGACVSLEDQPYVIAPSGVAATRYFTTAYTPIRLADGGVGGVLVTSTETTGRVLAERRLREAMAEARRAERELGEADRLKDEFLATLAHELRNPLAPIRTAAQLLARPRLGAAEVERASSMITRQVRHMARLLEDLLDVARITRGQLELRRERVALQSVVAAALEMARPEIDARQHVLDLLLPEEAPQLDADPVRIAQVLTNLLTNAAQYTPPGGRIRLQARLEGAECVLMVCDNGIGLRPEALARIFRSFSHQQPALERANGGLGVGLALARGLVELHGGSIVARSEGPGQGSEFVVRLPAARPARPGPGLPPADAGGAPSTAARRVLIADDNVDAAESLAILLRLAGHEVRVAHDGPCALRLAIDERPDVVVLDIGMPGMNGYEVARCLRREEWGRALRLIAVTGWGQDEDRRRALAAGFDSHLTKPFEPESLEALVGAGP
jgi:signal transduction histidine kinase/CheY-like chemotaxis protein